MFDPGGCTGRLRSCPFLGGWHTLRIGWAYLNAPLVVAEAGVLFVHGGVEHHFQERTSDLYVFRSIAVSRTGSREIPMARDYESCGAKRMSRSAKGRGA